MKKTLEVFDEGIWIVAGDDLKMFTIPFTTRMTIIKLQNNDLWIHSPVILTEEEFIEIDKLGVVKYIVAPVRIHSLGIPSWKMRYPNAEVLVSPKFCVAHPAIKADYIFEKGKLYGWHSEIEYCLIEGSKYFDEVVFFHKISKTLIVTDIIQKHKPCDNNRFWRAIKFVNNVLGEKGGTPNDLKLIFTNKKLTKQSKQTILSWDFDKLIISHGSCIKSNAKDEVKRVLSWI